MGPDGTISGGCNGYPILRRHSVPHPPPAQSPRALKDRLLLLALEICLVVAVIGLAILAARPGEYAPDDPEIDAGAVSRWKLIGTARCSSSSDERT